MNRWIGFSVALGILAGTAVLLWSTPDTAVPGQVAAPVAGANEDGEVAGSSSPASGLPPEPPARSKPAPDRALRLWQERAVAEGEEAGIPVTLLQADVSAFEQLAVGQTLEMPVPELGQTFQARLHSTHNQLNDVRVWKGQVKDGLKSENVIVTRGQRQTLVMLSTRQGAYTVRVDNTTGQGVLINETHANPGLGDHADYVVPPEWPEPPLPEPAPGF